MKRIASTAAVVAIVSIVAYIYKRSKETNDQTKSNDMAITNENQNTGTGTYPNHNYTVRGYRNNNPLNIRISSTRWQGGIYPSGDSAFCQFVSMAYGYRAAFRTFRTYILTYKCLTVRQIISRWAPNNENNTEAYIQHVCEYTGLTQDTVISYTSEEQMCKLAYGMSIVENGKKNGVPETAIREGFNLYINSL